MVRVALLLSSLLLAACPPTTGAKPCTGNSDCNLTAGGACLPSPLGTDQCAYPDTACPSGLSWGELSEGIAGQCVATDVDAGVDAPDAMPTDAPPGAAIDNYQAAELVIGQPDFSVAGDRGFTARSVLADGVAAHGGGLWVSDSTHNRVLHFSPLPTASDPDATTLLGRPSLTDSSAIAAVTGANLDTSIAGIAVYGDKVFVADRRRNRVLVWDSPSAGASATFVLGQTSMTGNTTGNSASQLSAPQCVWTDGVRLAVCDTGNHRVLIWNQMPTTNGAPADVVLGFAGFGQSAAPSTPSIGNMSGPVAIASDGTRLFVADVLFHRVVGWSTFPTTSGVAADFVLGQTSPTESGAVGPDPVHMTGPFGLAIYGNALFVAESSANNRVVVFQPIPSTTGAAASLVLGQSSLTSRHSIGGTPNARDFRSPCNLAVVGTKLFVGDCLGRRVLQFALH